jgi:hydroxymethylglutaryl-CoA reductase
MSNQKKTNKYDGFSKYNHQQRIKKLLADNIISAKDANHLISHTQLPFQLADHFVENFIGYFQMPLGVAVNFKIDERDYVVPMAIEESSVIAGASKTAKWLRNKGVIVTKSLNRYAIGQIQLAKIKNFKAFSKQINSYKTFLIEMVNRTIANNMVKRGGGIKDLRIRRIRRQDGYDMAVIHVFVTTCDSMGANLINQICEFLKPYIEKLTGETVNMCILSNLADTKLTQAKVIVNDIDKKLGNAIAEASLFAHLDPYRAATNNKGVLNGIDAVTIATGNDWRAVEAGIHAYAAHTGQYDAITDWKMVNNKLIGKLTAPITVGIVGGITNIHPTAALCLRILNVSSADELARVIAAVGLVQNLAALKALTTEGIINGHLRLHFTNICLASGISFSEISKLKNQLQRHLEKNKTISLMDLKNIITDYQQNNRLDNNDEY